MRDAAGRRLTDYFGPSPHTPALGPLEVVSGTGNTRTYQTASGERFKAPASASPWGLEDAAMRAGINVRLPEGF